MEHYLVFCLLALLSSYRVDLIYPVAAARTEFLCCWQNRCSQVVIVDLLISGSQPSGLLVADPDCGCALPWELSNYQLSLPSSQ